MRDELSRRQSADPHARTAEGRWLREAGFTIQKGDKTRDNKEAQRLYASANDLKVRSTGLDAQMEQLDMRSQRADPRNQKSRSQPERSAR